MVEKEKIQMRKRNMRLFPIYRMLSWDYLFFYTTNFLFLTQIKGISASDVVLIDSFYAIFGIIMQLPATFIIEYLGRKKSMVLASICNCLYMLVVMFSNNLFNLITAEILSSLAYGIKETADPALLNESIPPTKSKSRIFAKINQKGISNYYIINAISTICAGIFYDINPYIPITLSLIINVIITMISINFIEPQEKKKKHNIQKYNQINEIKDSFTFILKSERLKALILFSAITVGVISILVNYEISLLEDFDISAKYLCLIFAIMGIISGITTKKQEQYHNRYKNKSLCLLLGMIGISTLIAGIAGVAAKTYYFCILLIIIAYVIRYACKGIYYSLMEKYLRNFANEEIDTKIFTAKNFLGSIFSGIMGVVASFLLDRMNISYCMIVIGGMTILLTILMRQYMKTRVGLKPEEYSDQERKYDELNKI